MTTHIYYPYFTITPKMTRSIESIGVTIGYLQSVQIPDRYRRELVSKVTSEIVHMSTAIEGNTLTAQQVVDVLRGKKIHAQEVDIQEVINYNRGLTFVEKLAKDVSFEFSERTIRDINAVVLKGVRDDIAGNYRIKPVIVGDYFPPEHTKVAQLMREFVAWLNHPQPPELSPILYSGIAHYQLVGIHPFEDGNGRTTRILTTLMLLRYGYRMTSFFALESYYNRNRRAYYTALASADQYRVDGKPDLTRWLEYYVEGMLIEAERARSKIDELRAAPERSIQELQFTDFQIQCLRFVQEKELAKSADFATISPLSRKGTYNTVQKLVDMGLLQRIGVQKGAVYTLTAMGSKALEQISNPN